MLPNSISSCQVGDWRCYGHGGSIAAPVDSVKYSFLGFNEYVGFYKGVGSSRKAVVLKLGYAYGILRLEIRSV